MQNTQQQAIPKPGEYWQGQGGIYVGPSLEGNKLVHIIMATKAFNGEWGNYGTEIDGEFSYHDGKNNTQLILAAEPDNKLLLEITNHEADGHSDFYLPSNLENNLIYAHASQHVENKWHWSSTQCSADDAWHQFFEDGDQFIGNKGTKLAARAVRRYYPLNN